jgi:hypothetical protein
VQLIISGVAGRGLTQLIAMVAGVRREKLTIAERRDPAGTGAGGTISDTFPYGYDQHEVQLRDSLERGCTASLAIRLDRQTQPVAESQ